jgi:hypothetical protein
MRDDSTARRTNAGPTFIEALEDRRLLSGGGGGGGTIHSAATTAPSTTTALHLSSKSVFEGQDIVATVTVKSKHGPKAAGQVEILDNGTPLQDPNSDPLMFTLSNGKVKYLMGAGDAALFTGAHSLSAQFLGNGTLPASTSPAVPVNVAQPSLITTASGLQYATVKKGRGNPAGAGHTAYVAYTGFLASNGDVFDYASLHGKPYVAVTFPGQLIAGFQEGVAGMKLGEERVLFIPSALGYGSQGSAPAIPPNADLVFCVRLLALQ